MDGLDNKYLQKVNLEALQKETGLTLAEIAELANIGPKVVYKWRYLHKDGSRPDYNTIVRLLLKGATVETLFGVEYKRPSPPPTAEKSQEQITPTDLSWAFGEAMKLLQEKKAKEQNSEEKK